jgi:hypothetical protein
MSTHDDLIPISDLLYDDAESTRENLLPISDLLYDDAKITYENLVAISGLFYDDAGPHVVRAGYPPVNRTQAAFTPARGQELRALLNKSIVQLGAVSGETRRKTPIPLPPPVAIETLFYSGRAALDRAIEIRDDIIESGVPPSPDAIDELLDLIALAATE